jgi:RimK family alpha-L-glutamate ligase
MHIGILTRNAQGWESSQIITAAKKRRIKITAFTFSDILARVAYKPEASVYRSTPDLDQLDAIIIRPIGRGSLDEVIFRLDLLHRLERSGILIINPPASIEKAVDKYYALTLLEENGVRIPRTVVTENPRVALEAFKELNGDVVLKPIFGSRGMGVTRITDPEIFGRICRSLSFIHHVLYIQEYVPHGTKDIRAFVIGDQTVAAMLRISDNWKTNVSKGAKPKKYALDNELEEMVLKSAQTLGCKIAGVDVLEGSDGYFVNEVNSQPGFRGLQSVSKVNIANKIIEYTLSEIHQ